MVSGTPVLSIFCLSSATGVPIFSVASGYSIDTPSPSGKEKWLEKGIRYCFKCKSEKLDTLLLLIPIGQHLVTWPSLLDTRIRNALKCGLDSGHPCNQLTFRNLLLWKKTGWVGKRSLCDSYHLLSILHLYKFPGPQQRVWHSTGANKYLLN